MIKLVKLIVALVVLAEANWSCQTETISSDCVSQSTITDKSTRSEDDKLLAQLSKEINDLANSKTCENSSKWLISPIGNKPCGGPAGYIAYSSEIDVECFLKKVEFYTEQSKKFNQKYEVFSDCSLAMQPKSVKCENGKPVFVY